MEDNASMYPPPPLVSYASGASPYYLFTFLLDKTSMTIAITGKAVCFLGF